MDVSENRGTPKSSIFIRFSIINHPFWGTPIFGNTHIVSKWTSHKKYRDSQNQKRGQCESDIVNCKIKRLPRKWTVAFLMREPSFSRYLDVVKKSQAACLGINQLRVLGVYYGVLLAQVLWPENPPKQKGHPVRLWMRFLLVDKAKDEIFVEHLNVFVFSFKLNIPWMFPQTKILSMQWYVKIIEHKKQDPVYWNFIARFRKTPYTKWYGPPRSFSDILWQLRWAL